MLNLFIGIILLCSSIGATLSKVQTNYGFRKQRQHDKPLCIDREFIKA
jgi:hypothetical protein